MTQSAMPAIIDVNESDFETSVIAQSHHTVVVVDFWAPWCGPCRMLGPTLERLDTAAAGAWILAKVYVDHNQGLSQRYSVQGIPAVKAFKNGAVVEQFAGALPESQIVTWLNRIVPSRQSQQLAVLRETAQHNPKAVRHELASLLSAYPHDDAVKITYGGGTRPPQRSPGRCGIAECQPTIGAVCGSPSLAGLVEWHPIGGTGEYRGRRTIRPGHAHIYPG
jgi:putative thioredoxin